MMKKFAKIMGAASLLALSGIASASPILPVGGVTWDPDALTDFSLSFNFTEWLSSSSDAAQNVGFGTSYSNALLPSSFQSGQYLQGVGTVTALNGETVVNNFCPGCTLTMAFGGITTTLTSNTTAPTTGPNAVTTKLGTLNYSSAFLNLYVISGTPTGNFDNYVNLTPWLSFNFAADPNNFTSVSVKYKPNDTSNLLTSTFNLSTALSLALPNGGIAASNINDPNGTFVSLNGVGLSKQVNIGSIENENFLSSNTIPEPGSLALIGLGLLGFGLTRRKAA